MIELCEPSTQKEQFEAVLNSRLSLRDAIAGSSEETFALEFRHPLGPVLGVAQIGADEEVLAFCDLYGTWSTHKDVATWDPHFVIANHIYPCIGRTFAGHPSIYPLARDQLSAHLHHSSEERRTKITEALLVFEPFATKVLADICQ